MRLEQLALGVASGKSLAAAARAARVPETTARRWASEPSFKGRVEALRREIVDLAVGRLSALAVKAADALGKLLSSKDEETRLKAARAIISDLRELRQHTEMFERLEAIEARVNIGKPTFSR